MLVEKIFLNVPIKKKEENNIEYKIICVTLLLV